MFEVVQILLLLYLSRQALRRIFFSIRAARTGPNVNGSALSNRLLGYAEKRPNSIQERFFTEPLTLGSNLGHRRQNKTGLAVE